jgi:hypothetical protein
MLLAGPLRRLALARIGSNRQQPAGASEALLAKGYPCASRATLPQNARRLPENARRCAKPLESFTLTELWGFIDRAFATSV